MLGVQPLLGRVFLPGEDQPGTGNLIVLSEGVWRDQFNSDPNVIGQLVTVEGVPHTILAVMPISVRLPSTSTQAWIPLVVPPLLAHRRTDHNYEVIGRLKPQVPIDQAQREMALIARRIEQQYPERQVGRSVLSSGLAGTIGQIRTPRTSGIVRCGCLCPLDRMRQRDQSIIGSINRTAARKRHTDSVGRFAGPITASISHRKHAHCSARGNHRYRSLETRHDGPRSLGRSTSTTRARSEIGLASGVVLRRCFHSHRFALRDCAGLGVIEERYPDGPEAGRHICRAVHNQI